MNRYNQTQYKKPEPDRNIREGLATVIHTGTKEGWALPGGGFGFKLEV